MASFLTRDDGQKEQGEKAAEDSGDIAVGGLDVYVNVKQLPHALQELVAQLRAVPPTVEEVDFEGPAHGGNYFRMDPPPKLESAYDAGRLWVLGLISSCPSLRVVNLTKCRITSESEVERLCQGFKSNALLRWLTLNCNTGFGSDHGCGQVSHILASSSTTLETLEMEKVGMKAAGLSQLVSTLLANPGSRLQTLDVEENPECLTDEPAAQLLAQLVSSSSQGLRELRIRETGLAVDGAACLSSAFGAETTALEKLQVGPEPILRIILGSPLVTCRELDLTFSEEEAGKPEALVQMLRTNTSVRKLWLWDAHFSIQAWGDIIQAVAVSSTLSYLLIGEARALEDPSFIVTNQLDRLRARNPPITVEY